MWTDLPYGVHLIAAVGRSGQLGLNGTLPWHDLEDLRWFKRVTVDEAVIVGRNTLPDVVGLRDREIYVDDPETPCADFLKREGLDPVWRRLFIIGGAKTYARWLASGLVRLSLITHIDYDGECDVTMPQLWNCHVG